MLLTLHCERVGSSISATWQIRLNDRITFLDSGYLDTVYSTLGRIANVHRFYTLLKFFDKQSFTAVDLCPN